MRQWRCPLYDQHLECITGDGVPYTGLGGRVRSQLCAGLVYEGPVYTVHSMDTPASLPFQLQFHVFGGGNS